MKKILSALLAVALLLGCISGFAEDAGGAGDALPAVGEVIHGFEVKEIRDFPLYGAQLVLFEHQKTGGQMMWIANEDTDRAFLLSFPTRPSDDKGIPHVFEHATMFGSEKYPGSRIFFNLEYQTYHTAMGAYTMDAVSFFPVASLSEAQLLKLADYYVDSCFHPLIMKDESIFRTQAWHYDLKDAESELTYEGVVYSEMLGDRSLASAALLAANKATFPGASLSCQFGGVPEVIPEMTWQDVKDFHDKYYHPSNCFAMLYGKISDFSAFLALLDGTFSEYERVEFSRTEENYTRITEPVISKTAFPMAEGTDPANQSIIYYYILCPGMREDEAQEDLMDNLLIILSEKGSALQQGMKTAFPSGAVSCGREIAAPDDAVVFIGTGLNENDAEAFRSVVDEAIHITAENGFSQEMMESIVAQLEITKKLEPENGSPVEGVMVSMSYNNAVTGNPFSYAEGVDTLDLMEEQNREGKFQEACKSWLENPELYTLTTVYPAPGEKEKQDEALREKLAEIKAGMSEEELAAIIEATNAEPEEEDVSASIAQIKAVTVENLPEEIRIYPVNDETDEKGVRYIEAVAGVDGIGSVGMMIDAATLPQEDIHWARLYTRLLGNLDTEAHTREELDVLISRYLYDKTTGIEIGDQGATNHPYIVAEWTALDGDLAAGYDLMEELLFHTKFDNANRIAEEVDAQITAVRSQINQNAYSLALQRGMADYSQGYRYYVYTNFNDYYEFLLRLKEQMTESPAAVTEKLEKIRDFIHNNAGAICTFAGNEASIELNRTLAEAFISGLDHDEREAVVYDLPVPASREAIIVDSASWYNCLVATPDDLEAEGYDARLRAICNLVEDQILFPILRDQMGVYTPMSNVMDNGSLYVLTYWDPNVRETYEVYATLGDRIAALEVDQEMLDGYIMSAYSSLAKPEGELKGAQKAIEKTVKGKSQEETLDWMRQMKGMTAVTVREAAELFRKAWENGNIVTAGGASKIYECTDLFENILNPFNAQDASKVVFTDAEEGSEYYDAVRFVYENALMAPAGETEFGVAAPATAGDFFGAMYVLIGGTPNAQEEAMAFFNGYGLVPAGMEASTELTGESYTGLFMDVIVAITGAGWGTEYADASAETVNRGQMAAEIMALVNALNE